MTNTKQEQTQESERKSVKDYIRRGGIEGKSFEPLAGRNYTIKNIYAGDKYPYEVFVDIVQYGRDPIRFRLGSIMDHLEVQAGARD